MQTRSQRDAAKLKRKYSGEKRNSGNLAKKKKAEKEIEETKMVEKDERCEKFLNALTDNALSKMKKEFKTVLEEIKIIAETTSALAHEVALMHGENQRHQIYQNQTLQGIHDLSTRTLVATNALIHVVGNRTPAQVVEPTIVYPEARYI